MRRLIAFPCAGETLIGSLDEAAGRTGLLIISGGNEIRCGAHRGMASLAQRLAASGIPVFRFDRRGVGDSTGENGEFRSSCPDIGCAAATFAAETGIERIVAFGNCDAATALVLFGETAGIDRLILANPWVIEPQDALPPPAAIRARYLRRLRDPDAWLRLAQGRVDLRKLTGGLARIASPGSTKTGSLAHEVLAALDGWRGRASILLARDDNTAIAFRDAVRPIAADIAVHILESPSHSFAPPQDADWLFEKVRSAILAG